MNLKNSNKNDCSKCASCALDCVFHNSKTNIQIRTNMSFDFFSFKKSVKSIIHKKYTIALLTSIACTILVNMIINGKFYEYISNISSISFQICEYFKNVNNDNTNSCFDIVFDLFFSIIPSFQFFLIYTIIALILIIIVTIQMNNTTKNITKEYLTLVNSVWNRLSSIEGKGSVTNPFRKATYAFFVSSIDKLFSSQDSKGDITCAIRVLSEDKIEYVTIARSPLMSSKYIHSCGTSIDVGIPCLLNNKAKDSILIINDYEAFLSEKTCRQTDLNQELYKHTERSLLIAPIVVKKDEPVNGIILIASSKKNEFDESHAHHARFIAQTISFYEQYVSQLT